MRRRRRRRRMFEGVELNLAAMLDMAFQLLMFFILTFNVMPSESQVALRLPQAKPVTQSRAVGSTPSAAGPETNAVVVTVLGAGDGRIKDLAVGETVVTDLEDLGRKLDEKIDHPAHGVSQVVVQVDWKLHYQELMRVVEVCTQSKEDAGGLAKLQFVELRPN